MKSIAWLTALTMALAFQIALVRDVRANETALTSNDVEFGERNITVAAVRFNTETPLAPRNAKTETNAWVVTLAALTDRDAAVAVFERLRAGGYVAQISAGARDNDKIYLVSIGGISSEDDAVVLALRLKLRLGFEAASISR